MIERALVVGGGPGGMTGAIALARTGVSVQIAEIETDWRPAGIGIGLQSPPLRALKALDLFDDIVAVGRPHPVIEMLTVDGTKVGEMPQVNVNERDDPPFVTMSRMALHRVLEARLLEHEVDVRLGTTVASLQDGGSGAHVVLSDGSEGVFDLVIGADGLRSQVRQAIRPDVPPPAFAGQVIWRIAARCPPGLERYTMMIEGPTRIGLVPLPNDDLYLWMLDGTLPPERPAAAERLELFGERLGRYAGFAPDVLAQVRSGDDVDFRALHWILVEPPWHRGRVLLIGDAAHASTPHMAWGVGLAIEDALILGEMVAAGLEGNELGERLAARRIERCRIVVEGSLQLSRWEQEPDTPGADPGSLIGRSFAALAQPA